MLDMIFEILTKLHHYLKCKGNDPVYLCEYYKKNGCSHVDGMLCNMKSCNILGDFKREITIKKMKKYCYKMALCLQIEPMA